MSLGLIIDLPEIHRGLPVVVVIQWYRRWYRMKKAFPLADRKAQILICFRACLFSVYTWLAFVYVSHLMVRLYPDGILARRYHFERMGPRACLIYLRQGVSGFIN